MPARRDDEAAGASSVVAARPSALARVALRGHRARVALGLGALTVAAASANALSDHLGYAAALLFALGGSLAGGLWGSAVARAAAGVTSASRARLPPEVPVAAGAVALVALAGAAAWVALATALVALRSLFTERCAPGSGLAFVSLVALPGPLLAALLGALVTAWRPAWRVRTALAALAPLPLSTLASLWRFYHSPAVFSYDPFYGFFPGALYDERVPLDATLASYRLGTLGWIVAAAALLALGWRPHERVWRRPRARGASAAAGASLASGALLGLGVYLAGEALGHRHSAASVASALGGTLRSARCTLVYARSIDPLDARRTVDDCALRLAQLERFFGLPAGAPVTVYLFASAEQKRVLMGAADTYIAKPWRREVYLQEQPFPHPVLKHELAHVVAGAMAPWPLRVSARGRLYPLPGFIEGAAVAAAWEGESDASPHEWSAAMLELRALPSLASLTGQGFYLHAAGSAYTAAGSFSRWLLERYGAAGYRRAYADGDLRAAYGVEPAALEAAWHRFLREVPLNPRLRARAEARFRRAPLHARLCPHETASLHEEARQQLRAGALTDAERSLREVVRRDATELSARVELLEVLVRRGDRSGAEASLAAAQRALGPAALERLRLRAARTRWRWGEEAAAREAYAALRLELFDDDEARTAELERWALGAAPSASPAAPAVREAVRALLVGTRSVGPDATSAVALLGWDPSRTPFSTVDDAVVGYLRARQLVLRDRPREARGLLEALDDRALPFERLRAEALRLRAVARYLAGDAAGAAAALRDLAALPERPRGARDVALDWLDRVERAPVPPGGVDP